MAPAVLIAAALSGWVAAGATLVAGGGIAAAALAYGAASAALTGLVALSAAARQRVMARVPGRA